MGDIEKIIDEIKGLKPVSSVGTHILEISNNPKSNLSEIVDVIRYDQAITANLLKTCNSSYFGLTRRIESIKQAVTYLGIEKVAGLAVMESSADNFKEAQSGYDLDEGELWRYSVASALIAQDLAEKKGLNNVPLIFTSALLKDIGKVILGRYVQESYKEIMKRVQESSLSFLEAEKEVIGIDHAELGARVAEKWNFTPRMATMIRSHHTPRQTLSDDLAISVIYLADSICMMIGIGVGSDGLAYRYDQNVLDRMGFSDVDLQMTIADFWEKLDGIEELVNFSKGEA